MKRFLMAGIAVAAAMASPAAAQTQPAQPQPGCDRSCLSGQMNRFLDALAARQPGRISFAVDARNTQNEMLVKPGDGLWATISGLKGYRHVLADPQTGEVAAFFNLEEQGEPVLAMARLKIAGSQIADSEILVVRNDGFLNAGQTQVNPDFLSVVPPAKRMTREQLIAITDTYFEAIEQGDGDVAPFHAKCNRVENGVQTTNNPQLAVPGANGPTQPMGCHDQIEAGVFNYITDISPRRYHIVDPERGLVFGVFRFRHDGTLTEVRGADGSVRPMIAAAKRPFDVQVSELFKIEDGQIKQIEAVMVELPYRTPDAFPGDNRP